MKTVIVGAGFFGVAAGAFLQRKGISIDILDAGVPGAASRAASGYYNARWYKDRRAIERAAETAEALGVSLAPARPRLVRLDGSEGTDTGLTLIDREGYLGLLGAPLHADVQRVVRTPGGWGAVTAEGVLEAQSIYLAAGAWTDRILEASELPTLGVQSVPGAGIIYSVPSGVPQTVWKMVTPYRAVAVRTWSGGTARLCATTETIDNAGAARTALRKAGEPLLPEGHALVGYEYGLRPKLPGGPDAVRIAPGLYAGTGGAKIGAIYAFAVADKLYRMMREDGKC